MTEQFNAILQQNPCGVSCTSFTLTQGDPFGDLGHYVVDCTLVPHVGHEILNVHMDWNLATQRVNEFDICEMDSKVIVANMPDGNQNADLSTFRPDVGEELEGLGMTMWDELLEDIPSQPLFDVLVNFMKGKN